LAWLVFLVSRVVMAQTLHWSDLKGYFLRLQDAGALHEYGPLATLLASLPAWVSTRGDAATYLMGMKALGLVVDGFLFHAVRARCAPLPTLAYTVASALLFRVWLDRLDLYVGALLVVAVVVGGARGTAAVAASALVKFPFLALVAVPWIRERSAETRREVGAGLMCFLAGMAAGVAWLGAANVAGAVGFHGARTLQREGLLGNLLDLGRMHLGWPLWVTVDHGAAHVHAAHDGVLRAAGLGLLVAGVAVTAWRVSRVGTRASLAAAMLLAVVAYTVFNPVGSPQFAVVVVALLPWAVDRGRGPHLVTLLLVVAYAAAADQGFAHYTHDMVDAQAMGAWTLARNLVLLATWGWLAWSLGRLEPASAPATVP
jgi:hypothetical protein